MKTARLGQMIEQLSATMKQYGDLPVLFMDGNDPQEIAGHLVLSENDGHLRVWLVNKEMNDLIDEVFPRLEQRNIAAGKVAAEAIKKAARK